MLLTTWAAYEKRRGDAAKARELYSEALEADAGHVASLQVESAIDPLLSPLQIQTMEMGFQNNWRVAYPELGSV